MRSCYYKIVVSVQYCQEPPASSRNEHLFEHAIPVAGVMHIVSNCTADLHDPSVMQHWAEYELQLRHVTNMLCEPHQLEHFLQTCVRGTPLSWMEAQFFNKRFDKIVEWRWTSLTNTLRWFLPLQGPLTSCWTMERFCSSSGGDMRVAAKALGIQNAINDPLFWGYGKMVQHLQMSLDALAFWSENCMCHEGLSHHLQNTGDALRERGPQAKVWTRLLGKTSKDMLFCSCPMRGKRSAELACGDLNHRISEAASYLVQCKN